MHEGFQEMIGDFLLRNKTAIQLGSFAFVLAALLICEGLFQRREFIYPRLRRITANLSVAVLNNILLQISFPLLALGAAYLARDRGWGLLRSLAWPGWAEVPLSVLLLDLIIYGQHIAFHKVPLLWRLHRTHHADLDLDATSGIRFHPLEIHISMGIKIGSVLLLGSSPLAVFLFELLLMLTALFNHSNIFIPESWDRLIRLLVVTPDVHRVHHSIHREETNSNYGFNFPWWDRIFRTYRPQPRDGHAGMLIGIELFRSEKWLAFHRILLEPFLDR